MRAGLLTLALSAGGLALAHPASAQFVAPEGSRFHNGSTLPLEDGGDGRQIMRRLEKALDRAEPDEAAAALRALRADPRVLLLPFGPRTHMAALDLAARLVVQGGDGPVLQRVVEESRAAIAEARQARDLDRLLDHASRGSDLPTAAEAALDAARLEFERGGFWEAATLARRARGLPGAAELEAAARRHLPAAPPPPAGPGPGGFELQGALRLDVEIRGTVSSDGDLFSIPAAVDAGEGRFAILEDGGLSLVDRATVKVIDERGPWLQEQLSRARPGAGAPAPVGFSLARSGSRLLLPFNVLTQRGSSLWSSTLEGRVLALDLAAGGRTLWATELPPGGWPSCAVGPLLPVGPRVCGLVFRSSTETEVSLACLSQQDGRLLFEVPLVAGTAVRHYSSRQSLTEFGQVDKRAREGPPAERDGLVYACTGYGVVAVVDALTGWLHFTFRYDRLSSQDPDEYDPAYLYDTGGWNEEPVRLWNDRVVVAPGDSRYLYVLADEPGPSGQLVLDDPIERLDRRFVVGLLPDPGGSASPAVLATRRAAGDWGLVLLAPGGRLLAASPPLDPPAFFSGRPLLYGSTALVPSATGLLAFRSDELSAPPKRLPRAEGVPAVVSAVDPLDDGLVSFSPLLRATGGRSSRTESAWFAQWYRCQR